MRIHPPHVSKSRTESLLESLISIAVALALVGAFSVWSYLMYPHLPEGLQRVYQIEVMAENWRMIVILVVIGILLAEFIDSYNRHNAEGGENDGE